MMVLAAGGAGFWVYRDIQKAKAGRAPVTSSVPPSAPAVPAAPETPSPEKTLEKKFLAGQSIAVAGESLKMGRKESKDMTGAEATLRQAKERFAAADYEQAYTLAHQAIQEAAQATPAGKTYTVRKGDTLWTIAKNPKNYGRGSKWVKIWRTNEAQIPDFDSIEVGQELKIPSQ